MSAVANLGRFFASHPLTRDAPWKAWARFAMWQMRSRVHNDVVFPWIHGQKLMVRRGMTGATGNIYVGLHEFADMMLPLHFLREDDLFLDIGANIGSYTILASGVRGARVWAFEPDPETVVVLKRNVALNGLTGRVVVHECALGDREGEAAFTRGLDTVNRVAADGETDVRMVRIRTLGSLIGDARPSMMKMDVEGHEQPVVRGAETLFQGSDLKVIALETTTAEIEDMFHRYGFKRAYYDPFRRALSSSAIDLPSSNSVFVRDWEFVAHRLATAPDVKVLGKTI